MIRQPIVTIMGHVDHGKTLLLDKIRGTAIAAREAGGITQAIGASIIPLSTIKSVCKDLLKNTALSIPGLLFIDTPGHAAFTNLRKRGGNLADIAIVVVDINEGLKPQAVESLEILKRYKIPFVVAANKIDLIQGWLVQKDKEFFLQRFDAQPDSVKRLFDTKFYELVGQLFEQGFNAERFDRVDDYTKTVAVIPTSAMTGAGIPELLMILAGLAQKYLEQNLKTDTNGPGRGTILEVKEQKGIGTALDVIIYDGCIRVGDNILIAGLEKPLKTRVKALFVPEPHAEMREKKSKFKSVKEVHAANGVRISAPGVEDVVAGMPIAVIGGDEERLAEEIQKEVESVVIDTEDIGVIIKADALGSLEALSALLKEKNIPVRKASIGPITKKDLSDAEAIKEKDPLLGVILGFNIPKPEDTAGVPVFVHGVIYKLIEDFEDWQEEQRKAIQLSALDKLVKPCKIELLKGYVFRQSNPAIVGCEVLAGTLKSNTPLMNREGKLLTVAKGLQVDQKNVESAEKGKQVAVELPNVIVGRQIKEGDILYSAVPEEDFRKYKEFKEFLSPEEKEVLKEISRIMREHNPVWGV
ncbi:translation initiation factor IF-2 [Candidatus Woesearchaeota archaeon]|nr:MAG: translation initiation factor IF-2 [Candidatus Woesearchaeota archaeon]